MPLTADQQAMLQLLLERGQSYADLASLLGVDEAGVRTRARAALTELAGADPDRNVGLTDYLLGQADPIGRADAVRHLKDDPDDLELATELTQKLRLVAPQAELPRLPGEEWRPRPRRAPRLAGGRLPIPDRLRRKRSADAVARERSQRRVRGAGGPADDPVQAPDPADGRPRQRRRAGGGGRSRRLRSIQQRERRQHAIDDHQHDPHRREHRPAGLSGDRRQGSAVRQVPATTFAIPKAFQTLLPRTQAVYLTLAEKQVVAKAIKQAVSSGQPILAVEGKTAFTGIVNSANASQGRHTRSRSQASKGFPGSGAAALGLASANQPFFDLRLTRSQAGAEGLGLHRVVRARLGRTPP